MSVKIMQKVFQLSNLTATQKLVLLSLSDHARDDGTSVFPSNKRTAQRTALSTVTVSKTIASLEAMGYIEVFRTTGRVNRYLINVSAIEETITVQDEQEYQEGDYSPEQTHKTDLRPPLTTLTTPIKQINTNHKYKHNKINNCPADELPVYFKGDDSDLEDNQADFREKEKGKPSRKLPPARPSPDDLSWLRHTYRPLAEKFLQVAGKAYYPYTESERRLWYKTLHQWLLIGATPDDVEAAIRAIQISKLTIGGVQAITKTLRHVIANKGKDMVLESGYERI